MTFRTGADDAVAKIAAAIGDPARVRMLYCLMDERARTATELAIVADVSASTGSAHLKRLMAEHLVRVQVQGKHRYYSLDGPDVAAALEKLSVLSGGSTQPFEPRTPQRLRSARTCYDHIAGALGVAVHDVLVARGWLGPCPGEGSSALSPSYELTPAGARALAALGVNVEAARSLRRRFAFACLDWSERRPHVGGALAAAVLQLALDRTWVARERDGRALRITGLGRDQLYARLGVDLESDAARPESLARVGGLAGEACGRERGIQKCDAVKGPAPSPA
jgi:DNA-binding transcriptional ArsR family regulator